MIWFFLMGMVAGAIGTLLLLGHIGNRILEENENGKNNECPGGDQEHLDGDV